MKIYGGELVASGSSTSIPVTGLATTGSNRFNGNQTITGSIVSTVTPLVSGSSQITYSGLSGVPSGIISGSSQLSGFGFATTGSNTLIGNQTVNGNLVVTGSLTAQQFIVSSSVTHLTTSFSSGSQKFGDTLDDTHQFTGSVLVTGSLTITTTGTELQVNAGGVNIGNALTDNHIISGSVRFNSNSLFVSSSGDVLVGTTSSTYSSAGRGLIVVNGTTNALYGFSITGATKGYMYHNNANVYLENSVSAGIFDITQVGAGAITFTNNGAERLRINSGGNILVGTSSNLSTGAGTQTVVIRNGTSGQGLYFASVLNTADQYVPIGTQYDTSNGNNRAEMRFAIDGSDTNTRISFHTAAGTGTLSERVRISSGGNMGIGVTSPQDRLDVNGSIRFRANTPNFTAVLDNGVIDYVPTSVFATDPVIRMAAIGTSTIGANIAFHTGTSTSVTERVRITSTGVVLPGANGTQDFGSTSLRWGTIFTSDLSLSNGIGDYTIVEGEEKLYLYNNKNNKVYSFVLQEEDPATATPKKS